MRGVLGLWTWEDNDRLPDSFFSGVAIEGSVGPGPLGHDGEAETLPYFAAIPYLHPVLGHVLIGHPVAQPLPDGEYDIAFEGWFAGIAFLCLKHDSKSAHVGSTIFAASNWTVGGLGEPIVNGITSGLCENVIEQSVTITADGGQLATASWMRPAAINCACSPVHSLWKRLPGQNISLLSIHYVPRV